MKIAICDDEKIFLSYLRHKLDTFETISAIETFFDIQECLKSIDSGMHYDAVLMDINWGQENNGLDFASEIYLKTPHTRIIYVTGYSDQYVERIFLNPANLSGLIKKPISLNILKENLLKVQDYIESYRQNRLVISFNGVTSSIPVQDILYIESNVHLLKVHTETNLYRCYERLTDIQNRLSDYFLRCHKSYLVNMNKICDFSKNNIVLEQNIVIPVSKLRYQEAKNRYFSYAKHMLTIRSKKD